LDTNKKIYFASDFHLGVPDKERSLTREKLAVKWLDEIKHDAAEIYLMGDLFDFWFEYKHAIPKGFTRVLGKIAEINDAGIPIHLFTGNHDMWMYDYLPEELGVTIYREPVIKTFNGKKFYLGHGDGLGPGDHGYKFIKKVFASPMSGWRSTQKKYYKKNISIILFLAIGTFLLMLNSMKNRATLTSVIG